MHSECEVLPLNCLWWIGISLTLSQLTDCTTLPKKYQHICLKSKGRHGPGRDLNPWPPYNKSIDLPILYYTGGISPSLGQKAWSTLIASKGHSFYYYFIRNITTLLLSYLIAEPATQDTEKQRTLGFVYRQLSHYAVSL